MNISGSAKPAGGVPANSAANRAQTERANPQAEQASRKNVTKAEIPDQQAEARGSVNLQKVSSKTDTQKLEAEPKTGAGKTAETGTTAPAAQKEASPSRPQVSDDFSRAVAQKFIKKEDAPVVASKAKEVAEKEPKVVEKSRDGGTKKEAAKI